MSEDRSQRFKCGMRKEHQTKNMVIYGGPKEKA
jgi:hypothetical protein